MTPRTPIVALVAGSVASAASAGFTTFNFPLSGDQEVPAFATDATGTATLVYDSTTQTFDLDVFVEGLGLDELFGVGANTTPIHIHNAPAGSSAGIAIDLGVFASFVEDGDGIRYSAEGISIFLFEAELFSEGLYVNIHSVNSNSGELRGQVVPAPAAATLLGLGGLGVLRRRR